MSDIELLPCPLTFDGKYIYDANERPILRVHPGGATPDECAALVAAWNRRASDPLVDELVGALEPFAALADRKELDHPFADDSFPLNVGLMNGNVTQSVIRDALKVSDLRRARDLVAKVKKP